MSVCLQDDLVESLVTLALKTVENFKESIEPAILYLAR